MDPHTIIICMGVVDAMYVREVDHKDTIVCDGGRFPMTVVVGWHSTDHSSEQLTRIMSLQRLGRC